VLDGGLDIRFLGKRDRELVNGKHFGGRNGDFPSEDCVTEEFGELLVLGARSIVLQGCRLVEEVETLTSCRFKFVLVKASISLFASPRK
jgi:hypothetical protein